MPLVPGYNFVRSGAAQEFIRAYQHGNQANPERVSIVGFLRMVQHREGPPGLCIHVDGFDRLWAVCEDDAILANKIKQLLTLRGNWVMEHLSSVYFVLPAEVDFVEGATFQLRLPTGKSVDLDRVFGKPTQQGRDHYHRPFALS